MPLWLDECERALCQKVVKTQSISGGDINEAAEVRLNDGSRIFVKFNQQAPLDMFRVEAAGLEFLREGISPSSPLKVPQVRAAGDHFLALDFLELNNKCDLDDALGCGLAELHRAATDSWGLSHDNYIGTLDQLNQPTTSWLKFFIDRRLDYQLGLPAAKRLIPIGTRRRFDRLKEILGSKIDENEPASRLHGDLWSGNTFCVRNGVALYDPAVYGGAREVDLAMMRLFGGFSERVFDSYWANYPPVEGWQERVQIYQLYPLLVHLNLFGSSYIQPIDTILRKVGC